MGGRPKLPEGEALKRKYARNKIWRKANADKMNEYSRARNLEPERREYMKAYYETNAESLSEYRINHSRLRRGCPIPPRPCPEFCECCGSPPDGRGGLHVDHCHESGKFRGWICFSCNTGIGKLGDTLNGVEKALAYLQRTIREQADG